MKNEKSKTIKFEKNCVIIIMKTTYIAYKYFTSPKSSGNSDETIVIQRSVKHLGSQRVEVKDLPKAFSASLRLMRAIPVSIFPIWSFPPTWTLQP